MVWVVVWVDPNYDLRKVVAGLGSQSVVALQEGLLSSVQYQIPSAQDVLNKTSQKSCVALALKATRCERTQRKIFVTSCFARIAFLLSMLDV